MTSSFIWQVWGLAACRKLSVKLTFEVKVSWVLQKYTAVFPQRHQVKHEMVPEMSLRLNRDHSLAIKCFNILDTAWAGNFAHARLAFILASATVVNVLSYERIGNWKSFYSTWRLCQDTFDLFTYFNPFLLEDSRHSTYCSHWNYQTGGHNLSDLHASKINYECPRRMMGCEIIASQTEYCTHSTKLLKTLVHPVWCQWYNHHNTVKMDHYEGLPLDVLSKQVGAINCEFCVIFRISLSFSTLQPWWTLVLSFIWTANFRRQKPITYEPCSSSLMIPLRSPTCASCGTSWRNKACGQWPLDLDTLCEAQCERYLLMRSDTVTRLPCRFGITN